MEEIDDVNVYGVEVDADCVSADFDDYDLYGERMESENEEESDILLT